MKGGISVFRIKCEIAYDGTDFHGFQVQAGGRTVQAVFEQALAVIHKGDPVRVHASGRTDSGVHARKQVLHFDSSLQIPEEGWKRALNAELGDDIVVHRVQHAMPDFHARYDAVKKEYRYRILRSRDPDVFRQRYTSHYPYPLQIAWMQQAAASIIGTHDFTSFCAARTDVKTMVRTIDVAEIDSYEDELVFHFVGDGFLRQMVRILVGTLLAIGNGRRPPSDMARILAAKDRREAAATAPGRGLILWDVCYDTDNKGKDDGRLKGVTRCFDD